MKFYILLFNLLIIGLWCEDIERVIIPQGQPFSFDCQYDESVYFARKLNQWSEIEENNEIYLYLNFNFNYLKKENILRITSDSAESKHVGFYACKKAKGTRKSMNNIYQLILADVQSFYWSYVCHGPIGSCQRSDDINDENSSRFEVADQTDIELFCCGSVTGYKNVNINMNPIGDTRPNVEVKKKQETDGSWVVCANQRTVIRRTPYLNQQILTCELLTDDRRHSTLSSIIIIKDAILPDPESGYNSYSGVNQDDGYFNQLPMRSKSNRRLTTGKKVGIIIGSVLGGLLLIGLLIFLIIFIKRNKKASPSVRTTISKQYLPVKTSDQTRYKNQQDVEPVYEEPTELPSNAPVFMRC